VSISSVVVGFPPHRDVMRLRIRRGSFDRPSPGSVRPGFILPCSARSSEFLRSRSRASSLDSALFCRVSVPFIAVSPVASTCAGHPNLPLRSALRLSQPLDGFLRFRLRGLISSRDHVQGFSVQGFLPTRSHPGSSTGACLLDVVASALTGRGRCPRAGASSSRLSSANRCVASPLASLFGFLLLQVLSSAAVSPVPRVIRS